MYTSLSFWTTAQGVCRDDKFILSLTEAATLALVDAGVGLEGGPGEPEVRAVDDGRGPHPRPLSRALERGDR